MLRLPRNWHLLFNAGKVLAVAGVLSVTARLAAADRWDAPNAANPIIPGYFADPSLLQADGQYFLYATIDPWGGRTLGCWESSDFKQWTYHVLNWPTKEACTSPTSMGAMVWAPSVVRSPNGQLYMYVSVGSEIWVGTAKSPLGPWTDANGGRPLIPGNYRPGFHMIDGEAFIDDDGRAYLYWGSGWEWKNGHCFVVRLKPDMVTFDGEPADVTPGNYFEGPFLFKHSGHYYLSYSQGVTISDSYRVHYAIGDSPLGPFVEASNSPILVTDRARNIVSPGHHAVFTRLGRTYILYHRQRVPFAEGQAFRQICVDELNFMPDGRLEKVIPTHVGPALAQRDARGRLEATATASSAGHSWSAAAGVTDNNYATRWEPAPEDRDPWLQLDLGAVRPVGRQEIRFEYAWKTYRFKVQHSVDGRTWTELSNQDAGATGSPVLIEKSCECRYLRLTFSAGSSADARSVWEWAAFPPR